MADGAYLEALGQGEVLYRGTFNAVARTTLARPTAPAAVQARETGETEVTLSWNPVPGATAYMIGRVVGGSGLHMLCDVCPPSGEFVDTTATPGLEHTYMVAAIFPLGISTRTPSNRLTVGAAQLAAATASAPIAAAWDKPMSTGTPVSGTDANDSNVGASAGIPTTSTTTTTTGTTTGTTTIGTGTTTTTTGSTSNPCTPLVAPKDGTGIIYTKPMVSGTPVAGTDADSTNVGGSAGTPMTGSTVGCPAGTGTATGTGIGTGTTTTVHTATPITTTQTTSNPIGETLGGIKDALSNMVNSVSPATGATASVTGPGSVLVTWQASPTAGVTNYRISRRVNGSAWELLNTVGPSTITYSDAFFPITMFASGPARVSYNIVAFKSTAFSPAVTTGDVVVPPIDSTVGTPATGTLASTCKLDYQRADNMWAAFGRPDGPLGTETISLSPAQDKVFITDWKYEKTRNDGSNYYGSHLRIATNPSPRTIRLQLRTTTLAGLAVYLRTGSDTFWIRMDPGSTKQLQADLMEVFCEN